MAYRQSVQLLEDPLEISPFCRSRRLQDHFKHKEAALKLDPEHAP